MYTMEENDVSTADTGFGQDLNHYFKNYQIPYYKCYSKHGRHGEFWWILRSFKLE